MAPSSSTSTSSASALRAYPLKDVLERVPLPAHLLSGLSSKWRCVVVPRLDVADTTTEAESAFTEQLMRYLDEGVPVLVDAANAAEANNICGEDALAYLSRPAWNEFPKPQMCLRNGWGAPGTNLISSRFYQLVGSFSEVWCPDQRPTAEAHALAHLRLTEEERRGLEEAAQDVQEKEEKDAGELDAILPQDQLLELQLFHRQTTSGPAVEALGERLMWPSVLEDGVLLDLATRVAQRGVHQWWHLNDCGELVMQAALPLPAPPASATTTPSSSSSYAERIDAALYGDATQRTTPVKLVVFGPKGSYDFFVHDDEALSSGKVCSLDLFHTPDEALPDDASQLPILMVAVLQSGGRPLIAPPNLIHTSIQLADGVVVEQRRLSHLWLDEMSYFLERSALWVNPPIIYHYLAEELRDEQYVAGQLIPSLVESFRRADGQNTYEAMLRRRVVMALYTIAMKEDHFSLSSSSRASLLQLLQQGDASMAEILMARKKNNTNSLMEDLCTYWNTRYCWPKPGCVMELPLRLPSWCRPSSSAAAFLPVVYDDAKRIVYGQEKATLEDTVEGYFDMKGLEAQRHQLLTYLRVKKSAKDEILDELF